MTQYLEELKGKYGGKLPVDVDTEALAKKVHEAAERLTKEQVKEHVKEVHGAMERQDNVRVIMEMLKTLSEVGLKIVVEDLAETD